MSALEWPAYEGGGRWAAGQMRLSVRLSSLHVRACQRPLPEESVGGECSPGAVARHEATVPGNTAAFCYLRK